MPEREELHLNGFQICSDWRPARRPIPANIFDHEREINLCCVRHQKKKKKGSDSVGLGWGLRLCLSQKFLGDTIAGAQTTL